MKIQKDQSGIAHLVAIVAAVIVVAIIGFVGWKVSSDNKDSGNNNVTVNKQTQDACLQQIDDKDLCKFAASFNPNASYKATATVTGSSSDGTMTVETDGKGNTSLSRNAGGQQIDSITLGNSTYIKESSSDTWLKYTASSTNNAETSNPADDLKIDASNLTANNTISYKSLGKETCGSKTCFKYQIVDKNNPNTTQYIWFDDKDYQLQRFYNKDPNSGTIDMSFTYQSVNITAPSPVQDATSASGSSVPTSADIQAAIQAAEDAANSADQ